MKFYPITSWKPTRGLFPKRLIDGSWSWPLQALERRIVQHTTPTLLGASFSYQYRLRP